MAEQTEKKEQKRIVMWGTPRSLSTAMLRAMWNRKSCKSIPEPYGMAFFFGPERVLNWYPEVGEIDGFTFTNIKKELYDAPYDEDVVFIKDFPFYMYFQKRVDPKEFMPQNFIHTFLIRTPRHCVESGYRVFKSRKVEHWTEWEPAFLGFEHLWNHYNRVKEFQPDPLIFVADDLINYPVATLRLFCERVGIEYEDSMANWSEADGFAQKVENFFPFFKPFTETVTSTKGLHVTPSQKIKTELPPEIEKDVEAANVYYEKLLQLACRPAEAKSQ